MNLIKRPGEKLAARPLHFIWITDSSGSMSIDGKIESLNTAIRNAIPSMKEVAEENPYAEVYIRALKFSTGAQWHVSKPTLVDEFEWHDLKAEGVTDLGRAFSMLSEQMKMPPMPERALPPVLILLSDGQPTDDYHKELQELLELPWGKKAVRLAIAIGKDADHEVLEKFINNSEIKPLQANNAETLVKYIKWASTAVLKAASAPPSYVKTNSNNISKGNVMIPTLPSNITDAQDVW